MPKSKIIDYIKTILSNSKIFDWIRGDYNSPKIFTDSKEAKAVSKLREVTLNKMRNGLLYDITQRSRKTIWSRPLQTISFFLIGFSVASITKTYLIEQQITPYIILNAGIAIIGLLLLKSKKNISQLRRESYFINKTFKLWQKTSN